MEQEFLGPDYKYYRFINTPKELGMSSAGNMGALASDVAGLVNYTKLLIEGTGAANKAGDRPLGNKFFLKKLEANVKQPLMALLKTDMFILIMFLMVSIPFLSSAMGSNFNTFRGLVPGAIGDAAQMNPLSMMSGFMQGSNPTCTPVSLGEINSDNRKDRKSNKIYSKW